MIGSIRESSDQRLSSEYKNTKSLGDSHTSYRLRTTIRGSNGFVAYGAIRCRRTDSQRHATAYSAVFTHCLSTEGRSP